MSILMFMAMMLSIMICIVNHPMSLGMIVILQTVMVSMISGMMSKSFWYSYVIFLIMVGGLIILFIYMTSIASNEKFTFTKKSLFMMLLSTIMLIMIFIYNEPFIESFKNQENLEMLSSYNFIMNENSISLNKIYNMNMNKITILLMNFLLITLIASVKISSFKSGPMRQKF